VIFYSVTVSGQLDATGATLGVALLGDDGTAHMLNCTHYVGSGHSPTSKQLPVGTTTGLNLRRVFDGHAIMTASILAASGGRLDNSCLPLAANSDSVEFLDKADVFRRDYALNWILP